MRTLKQVASVVALTAGIAGGTATAANAVSFPSPNVCHLTAGDTDQQYAGRVGAWNGRYGCQNVATFQSQLKRDVSFQPDPIDDANTVTGITISNRVAEECRAHGSGTYYTHVESSGGTSGDGHHDSRCRGY